MKVLFLYLTSFSRIGGIENFNKALMKALDEMSIDNKLSYLATSLYDDKPDKKYIDSEYFMGFNGNKFTFIFKSFFQIFKYDTIIIGHINLYFLGIIAVLLNKKVIVIAHGIEVWDSNSFLKRYLLRNTNKVLCVSRYTMSQIVEKVTVDPKRITVFPNTLDPYFRTSKNSDINLVKKKYGIPESSKVVLTVSRLCSSEQYKGYENVIKILPELNKEVCEFKYLIVGGGDESEITRIIDLVNEFKLQNQVILAGEITDNELSELYNASDVFVMPSKGEGFGIVFLEALANGLPVIAGNKDGSVDPLLDGKLGELIDPDNLNEIKNSISLLLKNPKKKNTDLKKKTVFKYFNFNEFKQRLISILYE